MIIKIILIIAAVAIFYLGLIGGQSHATKAWRKVFFCLLTVTMVFAIIFPDLTTEVAHLFGVGRGADLLLYILTIAFVVYVLSDYIRRNRYQARLYELARKVAIMDAVKRYKINKK